MIRRTLHDLYANHSGNVSDKWSLYLDEYDRLFASMWDRPVRLLEIGVQNGGSLDVWSKFFPNAEAIVGCDINADCARLTYDDPRISVIVGDANASETQRRILQRSGHFDIIIDDGSHLSCDIVKSFALYFPILAEGGLFIAEDLHCSYWNKFEGGLYYPYSSMTFFKRLADVINHEHWGIPKARGEVLRGIFDKYDCGLAEDTLALIHSIEFINSMCVVRKAPTASNGLGHRIISGSRELVLPANEEWSGRPYELDPIFNQSNNSWSNRPAAPDEMLPEAERALAETTQLLSKLQQQNAVLTQQLDDIHRSKSWRIASALRLTAGRMKTTVNVARRFVPMRSAAGQSMLRSITGFDSSSTRISANLRKLLLRRGLVFYRQHMRHTQLGRTIGQKIRDRGLISTFDLHSSALADGTLEIAAHQSFDASDVEVDSRVPGFHLSPPLNFEVADELALHPCVNVLLPSLRLKSMSGGPNTALLLASMLAERGERVRLIACDASLDGEDAALFPFMETLLNRPVARDRIEIVDGFDRTKPISIGTHDVFLATAWWTAQMAKYAIAKTACKVFIYLIQDFEPILHEGSTFQARALETYGLAHIPVINTELLLDHLVRERAGRFSDPAFVADAMWFNPALDRTHYFPSEPQPGKKVLLFYARPSVARRNLFEIGVVALRRAVASGAIDKDNWEVWAMGEKLPPIALGEGVMLNPLPWMSFDDYAKRVRTADLLLSLMLSPHPSYPPLEMAASGKLVITNSFSVKTAERMRAFSPNIIVAEPNAESVAQALENAAGRINCGLRSHDPAGAIGLPTDWDESLYGIVSKLIPRLKTLREPPGEQARQRALGLPSVPRSDYEAYRKARLAARRSDGTYAQEPGLLCFVTSAYNTPPQFLEELGNSVFFQDGGMHFKWFILDNGSTEPGTRRALEKLALNPDVRLERVESNLGIIGGMRFCLEHATGRYILPLDSDDLIEPDCVHVLTRFIQDNDYPALLFTDEDKLDAGRFNTPYFKPDWDPVLFLHSCYIAHLCAIDRELALELGSYSDKSSEGCHDWDSFIRFMLAGKKPFHVPEVLYSWRVHAASTSGNIESKSYITESHRQTLQRFLDRSGVRDIELANSPLFRYNVDWWFRRMQSNPRSIQSIVIARGSKHSPEATAASNSSASAPTLLAGAPQRVVLIGGNSGELANCVENVDSDLIHLCWKDVAPLDDGWEWDCMALLELFQDAVMVGGTLHDGTRIVDGPRVFGFGEGCDCPDQGRELGDPGYGARMWKPHSASAVSTAHCVIKTSFLKECLGELRREGIAVEMLGPWLGALAAEAGKRVVYSPFMRARVPASADMVSPKELTARWLSRFWSLIPGQTTYSPRLGLQREQAYKEVDPDANRQHLARLQSGVLTYSAWLDMHLANRQSSYPLPASVASISLITTVYEGSKIELLDALAASIVGQTLKPAQWIIVAHGPIAAASLEHILREGADHWAATVIVEQNPLGIMGAMRRGLEQAQGDYIVSVDADDLLTLDAIHILTSSIARLNSPDLIFSDEDALVEGKPVSPYLRAAFDPVLNLDSSYIWHLCAINRQRALSLDVYTDPDATWCHDWDSVMRVANAGGRIEHVPEVLYHWRQHAASTTHKPEGDGRSLESVKHVLERQIARLPAPERFCVADWPEHRGARELYIARKAAKLPQLIWTGDIAGAGDVDPEAILVFAASGVVIPSQQAVAEAARLFELHPAIGAIGGVVIGHDDFVVDGCCMINRTGALESPWLGRKETWPGPYALASKPQTVATTGNSLAFFRVAALKQAGVWPPEASEQSLCSPRDICIQLAKAGWMTAFSPLVRARGGIAARRDAIGGRKWPHAPRERQALVRYGTELGYRG
ncbi:rhamnosyltransferase WsaF family glycosyltransferase [Bradyrhizobium sp. AZCC 2230]|uniref:rhamnosyltransferase WsaF family glycosyltransferase n=1 Tax=Bradyrhizobium sp. AZCC 2230 TaxID=3117021 RepID=UPI002FF42839